MGFRALWILWALLCAVALVQSAAVTSSRNDRKVPSQHEMKQTDETVTKRLAQMQKVIDALQDALKGVNDGYDRHTKSRAEAMKAKFDKLSVVIAKLGREKKELIGQNHALKKENTALIDKIEQFEVKLKEAAKVAENSGSQAWLRNTAADLKAFLENSGLTNYASPHFSPIVAGVVSYGVMILPLVMITLYLVHNAKHLSVLRVLMGLNLFDLGFATATIVSIALLLGDPFEGMRHISDINFVFIQLVLAAVFWLSVTFMGAAIYHNKSSSVRRYLAAELVLRSVVAADYAHRVWIPVIERVDQPIGMPGYSYFLFFCAAIAGVRLTSGAMTCAAQIHSSLPLLASQSAGTVGSGSQLEAAVVDSLLTRHDD